MLPRSFLPATFGLVSWLALSASAVRAHENPMGDVCPHIHVDKGFFHILCQNHGGAPEFLHPDWFRSIYRPNGQLVSPRHRITDRSLIDQLNAAEYEPSKKENAKRPTIEWVGLGDSTGKETPRLVLRQPANGGFKDEPLPFAHPSLAGDVYLIEPGFVALLNSLDDPADGGLGKLDLAWCWRGSFQPAREIRLGLGAMLAGNPTTSHLVWVGGRVWVAWVRPEEDRKTALPDCKWETVLSSYDPALDKLETHKLPGRSHWNAQIDLKTTAGWICAAWHASADGGYPGTAVICTAFEKVPAPPAKGQASAVAR